MKVSVFREYQYLAAKGRVHPLTCGNNSDHTPLVAFRTPDGIELRCMACSYVQHPGLALYKAVEAIVEDLKAKDGYGENRPPDW